MPSTIPRLTYGLGVIPYAGPPLKWLVENVGTNTDWWAHNIQPWLEPLLWPIAPAFLLGLFLQDLYNRKSWVREIWRRLNTIIEIDFLAPTKNENIARVEMRIKTAREIRRGEIRIFLEEVTPRWIMPEKLILAEDGVRLPKSQTKQFVIATIPIKKDGQNKHAFWGEKIVDPQRPMYVIPGTKNIVTFRIRSGFRTQSLKFQFELRNQYEGAVDLIQVIRDDIDLFENKRARPAMAGLFYDV